MDVPAQNTQALPTGTRLEEFLIERVLGAGGFGITYLARDTALGRQVVIKENLPVQFAWRDPNSFTVAPRHSHGEDADNFAWSLENFSRESAMLASLDHPGIVKVHRSFLAHGTAFFVMPYVEGMPLDELVKQRGGDTFSEDELHGMLQRVLGALCYLHDRGIYHRDIKPGNILITSDGEPVLIDFGSARQKLSERSMTVVESPGYTPFEQLQSRGNVGPWSDLYALAATLAKIITGEAPPKATDRAFDDPWVPLSDRSNLNGRYSTVLLTAVDRAFAARPGDRWQDAGEWLGALAGQGHDSKEAPALHQPELPARPVNPASPLASGEIGDEMRFPIRGSDEVVVKYVPGGRFQMGSPPDEEDRSDDEDQVWVTLSSHFWMGEAAVTQELWKAVMGSNPSNFKEGNWKNRPVENVKWHDAQKFIAKLNAESPLGAGWKWALPTEAQWERACRGGTTTATAFGDSLSSRQANFDGSHSYGRAERGPYLKKTTPVKSYEPNAYGLYDMHGNVWEWCADAYKEKLPGGVDPLVSAVPDRVRRGGSWSNYGRNCRSSDRAAFTPVLRSQHYGFRLAVVPTGRAESESALMTDSVKIPLITPENEESSAPGTERDFHITENATMRFCWIPPGEFVMGGSDRALGRREDEVQHKVVLTKGYWMSKHQVTQRDWIAVVKHNPSRFDGSDLPVENVSWFDVCGVKGRQVGFLETIQDSAPKGWRFDLPTEAEWERACRAGGDDQMIEIGQSIQHPREYLNRTAWYCVNSEGRTQPVGKKEANAWGLHDMIGNVWEWCRDSYGLFSGDKLTDPEGGSDCACRVLRGGGWCNDALRCRPFCRDYNYPDHVSDNVGFRLVLRPK